jgi:hypothetical protein
MDSQEVFEQWDRSRIDFRLAAFRRLQKRTGLQECYIATLEIRGIVNRMLAPDCRITLKRHRKKKAILGEIRTGEDWSIETRRNMTDNDWADGCGLITATGFWDLPPRDIHATPCMDGDAWTIEGFGDDRYHFVYRYTDSGPEIYDLGRALARFAGLRHFDD